MPICDKCVSKSDDGDSNVIPLGISYIYRKGDYSLEVD